MKKWKRGAAAALAAAMTMSMMLAGMTVSVFAEEETTEQPVSFFEVTAEPLDFDQMETGTAAMGYMEHDQVVETGETVDCYVVSRDEQFTVNADSGVTYQIVIRQFVKDDDGKCFIGDYNGLLLANFVVKADGTIVHQRMIDDVKDVTLTGKTTFDLNLGHPYDPNKDGADLLFHVRITASKEDPSGETASEDQSFYFRVDGEKPDPENPAAKFTDVAADAWYYDDVNKACKMELVNGRSETIFAPEDHLTYAEAVKLAACMNQKYNDGKVTLKNGSPNWYDSYVEYAKSKGIIDRDYDWNAEATRAGYVEIFAKALPDEAFSAVFEMGDPMLEWEIPDVSFDHPQAEAIYKLYRAGILNGNDEKGTFEPDTNIKRCQVAAILTRMMDPQSRVRVAL
jgi:hypothetical protein